MIKLIFKGLLLVMLALAFALPAISYAYSEPPKIISTVLSPGATSKIIRIPKDFSAIRADVVWQMSGVDKKAKVSVLVGTAQADLAWPGNASATLNIKGKTAPYTVTASVLAQGVLPNYMVSIEITCIKKTTLP